MKLARRRINLITRNNSSWPLEIVTFTQAISDINLVPNSDMEVGDPPIDWSASADCVLTSEVDEHEEGSGLKSISVIRNGALVNPYATDSVSGTTVANWYLCGLWLRKVTSTHVYCRFISGSNSHYAPETPYYQSSDWGRSEVIVRSGATSLGMRLTLITNADGQEGRFDDVYVKAIALNEQASLPNANAEIEVDLNLPTSGTYAGQRIEVMYRISGTLTSEANYWVASIVRNAINDNWNFELKSVSNGSGTSQASLGAIGTPDRLIVRCYGTQHQCLLSIGGIETPLHMVVNAPHNDTATGVNVVYSDGMMPVRLKARASVPFDYGLSGTSLAFLDGDSKTDETASYGYWPPMFKYLAERRTRKNWSYYNVADAGDTLAVGLSALPSSLAELPDSPHPDVALVNFGANDVKNLLVEATWKEDLRTYIETLHTKWDTTPIYFMLPWRQGEDVDCDTLASWITAIAGEYSDVFVGPDERTFLKGNDDGATTMQPPYPNAHPNGWGARLTAQQWATIVL